MVKKFKKGKSVNANTLTGEDAKYLDYKMVTDLFDFQELIKADNCSVKHYKDSHFIGNLCDKNIR